jgi:DNA polymerase III sliding clamp (beta) subunit (PCNA family)
MFETKTLKTLLNEVLKANHKSVAIMQHAKLTNGTLEMHGLGACHFVAETGTDLTGFLDVRMYNKTGNLATSMSSGNYSPEDYPSNIYPTDTNLARFQLPPELFSINFQQFAKYTSDDETRACLQGIYFNSDLNEVTATNGHVLLAKKLDTEIPIPFLIAPHSFKILDVLSPFIEVAEVVKDVECKVTVDDSEEIRGYDFLRVSGDGFSFVSKCMGELPYPDYNKAIPKPLADLSVTLSPEAVGKLISALTALLPFANCKTHLCIFENDEAFVHSIDTGKHIRVKIGERILAEKYVRIAFNIRYLLQVLKDASTGGSMTINYGATQISAVTVQTEKQRTLIMPLRIVEEEPAFGIPPEYIDVEPVKASAKKPVAVKLDKAIEKFALLLQERLGKKQLLENLKAMEELL